MGISSAELRKRIIKEVDIKSTWCLCGIGTGDAIHIHFSLEPDVSLKFYFNCLYLKNITEEIIVKVIEKIKRYNKMLLSIEPIERPKVEQETNITEEILW